MQFKNLWFVVWAALLLAPGCAMMGTPTTRKIDDLNTKAMADFKAGKAEKAQERLQSALSLAEKEKVTDHRSVAETHMNLGVVQATGSGQRRKAVDQMVKALIIKPGLTPEKAWRNAKVDKAFASAQKRAGQERKAKEQADKTKTAVAAVTPSQAPVAPPPPAKAEEKPAPTPEAAAPVAAVAEPKSKKKSKKAMAAEAAEAAKAVEAAKVAEVAKPTAPPSAAVAPTTPSSGAVAVVAAAPVVDMLVEAKVPSPVPEPVFCPLPDEVPPGKDLAVWCAVDPSVHAKKATLFVRPPDQSEFAKLAMERSAEGWWVATIPAASVKGTLLQFYVQAEKQNAEVLAATGNDASPGFVLVRPKARPVRAVMTQSFLDGDDDPAAGAAIEEAPVEAPKGFQWRKLWVALQGGSAYGWHSDAALEFRPDIEVAAGTASAGTFQVLPEIGYRLNEKWSASLQLRLQKLPNEGDTGGRPGGPAPGAISALLRALYETPLSQKLNLGISGYLGGGEGVRFVMDPIPTKGRSGTDTVRGGPFLIGAGVGAFYAVTERLALSADLRALVGVPDKALLGEFNLGFRYAFQ